MKLSRYLLRIGASCMLLGTIGSAHAYADSTLASVSTRAQLATAIDGQIEQPRFDAASWGIAVV